MARRLLAALVLAGAVLVIYWAAIPAYFLDDDFQWLVTRWSFHPSDLLDLGGRSHFYRPVVELYFWVGVRVFDGSPVVLHIPPIVVHVLNSALIYFIAEGLGMRRPFAYTAAVFFAVQPSYVAAVAWVGALAECVGTFFGLTAILLLLRYRCTRERWSFALAVTSFGLALLTHESMVVFLPLIALADWAMGSWSWRWRDLVRTYGAFVLVLAAYLAIDLTVNAKHYVITEGGYRIGPHIISNAFQYVASLYVGERTLVWHLIVAGVLAVILARGSARARMGVVWMFVAMLPFLPFDTANVSRYAYLPAVGLALLMAEGASALDDWLKPRWGDAARVTVITVLIAFAAIRFANFARRGVADITARMESYRTFLTALRHTHPRLDNGAVVPIDAKTEKEMPLRFLEAAIQWEYKNPTITVKVE